MIKNGTGQSLEENQPNIKAQLISLLEKSYSIALNIQDLIEKKEYDDIENLLSNKDNVMQKIRDLFQQLSQKEAEEIKSTKLSQDILKQESKNITELQKIQNEIKIELKKTNNEAKLLGAYSQDIRKSGTLLDFSE